MSKGMAGILLVFLSLLCAVVFVVDRDSSRPGFTDSFSRPTQIDHPYFPLVPGTTYTCESETGDGSEEIIVEVLNTTRDVMGINCVVVRDRVYCDSVLLENTHDYYAQDDEGNVWYMGEEVDNYNYDEDGTFIDITHEGAWEWGLDVAGLGVMAYPGLS